LFKLAAPGFGEGFGALPHAFTKIALPPPALLSNLQQAPMF
jgi:hypothetical protein